MTASFSVEPLLASLAKAERHMRSEYGTNMVGVMETVGEHPHFVMPIRPGQVVVLSGRESIDALYKSSVQNAVPKASRVLSQLVTDWFVFIENVPTRHWVAENRPLTVQTVTIFVTDDAGGITGEYAWQRADDGGSGTVSDTRLPDRAIANLDAHERLIRAIAANDAAALADLLAPDCIWAQRDYRSPAKGGAVSDLRGREAAIAHLSAWHEAFRPEHATILNRHVSDWYVLSEELWLVRPGGSEARQCRTVSVYPLEGDGRFQGGLGFGRDQEDPAPSAGTRLGNGFWTEPGVAIADVQLF